MILDSFNLMPSDCVITTDENTSKGTKMIIKWILKIEIFTT